MDLPKYRKNGKYGFVELSGRRVMLGHYNSEESRRAYDRVIAEWLAAGRSLPIVGGQVLICELVERFFGHCQSYYRRPDGSATSEVSNYRRALSPVVELYGDFAVGEFGPRQLAAIRAGWIDGGLVRGQINTLVRRVVAMFRWGVSQELCSPDRIIALGSLKSLARGRSDAVESEPVRPVPQGSIDAIRPHVGRQVWAMVQLQLLAGARSGELVGLRQVDIDMTGEVWLVDYDWHKTAYRGRDRVLYFGPQAQAVLREFFDRPIDRPLFSPRDAAAELAAKASTHRRPNQKPNRRKTKRKIGEQYTPDSYRRAIQRACDKAGIDRWHPHQLRHNAATRIRKQFGLEAAQVILGHATADVTQIYAEVDKAKALAIAEAAG